MSADEEREWQTRKQRISPVLDAVGWPKKLLASAGAYRLEEYETIAGPADYALCIDDQALGVVEAKKLSLGPQNVLTQSERYSRGAKSNPLRFGEFHVPFLYSTNGEVIWFADVRNSDYRSRRVSRFHTPSALREMLGKDFDAACRRLRAIPNNHPRILSRPYQIEANAAVESAIAARKREMLLAMATGTGKTFTVVNQIYRLMKSGVAQRVLFLVDRRALAAQAVRAFKSFEPEPALKFDQIYELYSQKFKREDFDEDEKFDPTVLQEGYLTNPQPCHAFGYVCTIQRLAMNLFGRQAGFGFGEVESGDEDADQIDIPIHAFDLIVADECHRGYTGQELSIWRDTLNHFDAIRIGLTSNKQLNFVQHILTVLKPGGRAAVVLPDNCLFADQAGEVFKILTEDCDLHTVLRLPRGTFTPYSQGVKANVVFFTKGYPTDRTWIYDARSNVPGITKKDRPLAPEHFTEFEKCFGADANGKSKRKESDSPASTKGYLGGNRWRCFSIADVKARDFKLDSFKWLKDDSLEDADELPPPEELATDAIGELDAAVEELNAVLALLENGAVK